MSEIDQNTSDGYHTFAELYLHRHFLFMALMISHPEKSWRSKVHADGTMYPDWFIAGMNLPAGVITYHLPIKAWENLDDHDIPTLQTAPEWDGHTPHDVLLRISDWMLSQTRAARRTTLALENEIKNYPAR